ncbi:restriction endonuclease subunit S [Corynebacterium riegelii]|uniref:restriction endonuclease subunit S n=1 Tax=Corynebacterium riegelii TaxID=156976 RepID=UPI0023F9BCDF|nr:restriction endonuclease subunit S [Corynebacterium riegelii]
MSKVDELIRELCPDGVQRVALGELLSYEQPGKYAVKSAEYHDEYKTPVLTAGQSFVLGYTNEEEGIYPASLENPVVIFDDFTTSFKWVDFPFKVKSSAMKLLKARSGERDDLRFIYYAMQTIHYQPVEHARQWIGIYSKFQIPLPPLQVQEEIVRILDQFVELDRELEQEVGGRELQKTALSNALFDQMSAYPLVPLQSIGTWFGGGTPSKKNDSFWKNGVIPWVSPKDMQGHSVTSTVDYITEEAVAGSSAKLVPAGSTALVTRSSILDKRLPVAYFPQTVAMNQDLKAVCPQDGVNGRYLFNALEHSRESILLQAHKKGGSVASLDTKRLMLFEVPLPPLEVQEEIANKLDTFTEYIDSLKRERELRQKQYEYYRDQLLDFPVKE